MHFNLILIGQPPLPEDAMDFDDLLRIHVFPPDPANDAEPAHAQIPRPSFYLVRPDGHVGLCGARLEVGEIARYFSERLRLEVRTA
jgi:hypothetical protein